MKERKRMRVSVCEREKENERVSVCQREKENERVSVCEREKEESQRADSAGSPWPCDVIGSLIRPALKARVCAATHREHAVIRVS